MKKITFLLCTLLIITTVAISAPIALASTYPLAPDVDRMMATIEELSQNPRGVSNEEIAISRAFIIAELEELGFEVTLQEFEVEIVDVSAFDQQWFAENEDDSESLTPPWEKTFNAVNIIATIRPDEAVATGDILIISAHYDTVNDVLGANDNASGVAVILELARLLRDVQTDTEIRFIFFDVEEIGLLGAIYYVEQLTEEEIDNTIGILNFDMLAGAREGKVRIFTADLEENFLIEILRENEGFSHVTVDESIIGGSDHMAFYPVLIPGLLFSHYIIWEEFHNEYDVIDNLCADMLLYAARAGLAITLEIMSKDTPSFRAASRPVVIDEIFDVQNNAFFPINQNRAALEQETGIILNQVRGENTREVRFEASIRMFAMPEVLTLTGISHMMSGGRIQQYTVNMQDVGVPFERLREILTAEFGDPIEDGGEGWHAYIWNNANGNFFSIIFNEDVFSFVIERVPQGTQNNISSQITRGDFGVFLYSLLDDLSGADSYAGTEHAFSDTNRYEILALRRMGIVKGTTDNQFLPEVQISRQEAAVILARVVALFDIEISLREHSFEDAADIAAFAADSVSIIYSAGIMSSEGDTCFNPQSPMTQEQAVIAMMQVLSLGRG